MTKFHDPKPTYWNKASVEKVADIISAKLDFEIGDPVENLVTRLGGKLKYGWEQSDEVDGGSIVAKSLNDFEIAVSEHTSAKRDRFTIAHELGHLFLHLKNTQNGNPNIVMRATRHVRQNDQEQRRAEWEANWFAAQLLMPREHFKRICGQHGTLYAANFFGVSEEAANIRSTS